MSAPIMRLFATIVVLFAVLVAWTSRWSVFDARALRDNPLNARPLIAQLHVKRGAIEAADGTVLARSVRGPRGTYRRAYPAGALFGHPVGYANVALQQLSGIERFRNGELSGQARASSRRSPTSCRASASRATRCVTTLDPSAQRIAERAARGDRQPGRGRRAGSAHRRGEGDGEHARLRPERARRPGRYRALNRDPAAPLLDRATQSSYAPGSTFKVITAAAAIDSGKYTPDSVIDGSSPKTISGVAMSNDLGTSYGTITLTDAMTNSVNTVFGQIGEALGKRTMADYMRRFGFYASRRSTTRPTRCSRAASG